MVAVSIERTLFFLLKDAKGHDRGPGKGHGRIGVSQDNPVCCRSDGFLKLSERIVDLCNDLIHFDMIARLCEKPDNTAGGAERLMRVAIPVLLCVSGVDGV